ncbi:NTP transferase domain-containing protein [Halorubrum sp. Ea1]|uniref:NTP transferase domain-containing protein n=1 Tax=Halorubrum sp. Ea1 TaxID=1480718 RepID=UPI001595D148|nr:NTP transferase domain-containing protein [Halorubrum sp. Ea1]
MDAIIPAAERGSRLGKLTDDRQKGLGDVAGRPLLAHVFETAVEAGVDELVVVVGYEAGKSSAGSATPLSGLLLRTIYQRERLGLGHAVLPVVRNEDSRRYVKPVNDTTDRSDGFLSYLMASAQ